MTSLLEQINILAKQLQREIKIMEVCGTHTQSIYRYGIKDLLPENISLISGPGCPVCVTDVYDIDYLLSAASLPAVEICCYGDMLRVPGSHESLYDVSAKYGNVHIVTSADEALSLAISHPEKIFIFWAVGFETTTPMTAVVIKKAAEADLNNFKVICNHKTMPSVLSLILKQNNKIDALLCPGHVAVITGISAFSNLPCPAVISGFEEDEILSSILLLLRKLTENDYQLANNYKSFVKTDGNPIAMNIVKNVFEETDACWRGLGIIQSSGLKIKDVYKNFDGKSYFGDLNFHSKANPSCLCGDIIKGNSTPQNCRYFGKECTPATPIGPCMVSSEGACSAFYKYGRKL